MPGMEGMGWLVDPSSWMKSGRMKWLKGGGWGGGGGGVGGAGWVRGGVAPARTHAWGAAAGPLPTPRTAGRARWRRAAAAPAARTWGAATSRASRSGRSRCGGCGAGGWGAPTARGGGPWRRGAGGLERASASSAGCAGRGGRRPGRGGLGRAHGAACGAATRSACHAPPATRRAGRPPACPLPRPLDCCRGALPPAAGPALGAPGRAADKQVQAQRRSGAARRAPAATPRACPPGRRAAGREGCGGCGVSLPRRRAGEWRGEGPGIGLICACLGAAGLAVGRHGRLRLHRPRHGRTPGRAQARARGGGGPLGEGRLHGAGLGFGGVFRWRGVRSRARW
jgi:hypothetical protein